MCKNTPNVHSMYAHIFDAHVFHTVAGFFRQESAITKR